MSNALKKQVKGCDHIEFKIHYLEDCYWNVASKTKFLLTDGFVKTENHELAIHVQGRCIKCGRWVGTIIGIEETKYSLGDIIKLPFPLTDKLII